MKKRKLILFALLSNRFSLSMRGASNDLQRLRFANLKSRTQFVRFLVSAFLCLSVLVSFLCHHHYYSQFGSDSSVKHMLPSFLNTTSRKNIIISVKDRQVQHSHSAGETNLLPDILNDTIAKAQVVSAALGTSLPLIHIGKSLKLLFSASKRVSHPFLV